MRLESSPLITDLVRRAEDSEHPHVSRTVGDFIENVNNPDQIRMILDVQLAQKSSPPPFD